MNPTTPTGSARMHEQNAGSVQPYVQAGAPGATDAERAAWLADKIVAHGDYAKEAAAMLRRWPAPSVAAAPEASRDAILRALIAIGHQITADEIRFFRDPSKDTTALAQLCDSLEAAWPAGVAACDPTLLQRAYEAGWVQCATWAERDDLITDCDSGAYTRERDAALAKLTPGVPACAEPLPQRYTAGDIMQVISEYGTARYSEGVNDALNRGQLAVESHSAAKDRFNDLRLMLDAFGVMASPAREPFVVKHYTGTERPIIKGNGFDGLEVGEDRDQAQAFVDWINRALGVDVPATGEKL